MGWVLERGSYDLYHPLKIHVPKYQIKFTKPEVKGESETGSVGGAHQNGDFSCVPVGD